jgi:hypothetical protein
MRVKDARRRDGFQLSQLEMSQLEKDRWRWVHGTRSTGSSMNHEKQKVDMQGTEALYDSLSVKSRYPQKVCLALRLEILRGL